MIAIFKAHPVRSWRASGQHKVWLFLHVLANLYTKFDALLTTVASNGNVSSFLFWAVLISWQTRGQNVKKGIPENKNNAEELIKELKRSLIVPSTIDSLEHYS